MNPYADLTANDPTFRRKILEAMIRQEQQHPHLKMNRTFSNNDFPFPGKNQSYLGSEESDLDQATREVLKACETRLADSLNSAIKGFAEQCEGRALEHSEILAMNKGHFIRVKTAPNDKPREWENFYAYGRQIMGYRFLSSSIVNQGSGVADFEATLQTALISEADWPESVKKFMEAK